MARPTATSPACSRRSPAPRSSGSPSGSPGGIAGKAHALPVCAGAIARSPWSWASSSSTPASTRRRRRSCRRTSTASRSPLRRAATRRSRSTRRTGPLDHAQLLRRHGYGVLLYDSRGRGESEGTPNAWGWGWEKDVDGALAFLAARPDVDERRIGGLGLSTRADVLIHVAPERRELRAVVSDGATAASLADQTATFGYDEAAPYFWTLLTAGRVFSGSSPGPPLEARVADISPTPLLLIGAGGFPTEIDFNRHYAQVANQPFEYWELPEVGHTAAVRERPEEYERRVVGFFDEALLGRGTS